MVNSCKSVFPNTHGNRNEIRDRTDEEVKYIEKRE